MREDIWIFFFKIPFLQDISIPFGHFHCQVCRLSQTLLETHQGVWGKKALCSPNYMRHLDASHRTILGSAWENRELSRATGCHSPTLRMKRSRDFIEWARQDMREAADRDIHLIRDCPLVSVTLNLSGRLCTAWPSGLGSTSSVSQPPLCLWPPHTHIKLFCFFFLHWHWQENVRFSAELQNQSLHRKASASHIKNLR